MTSGLAGSHPSDVDPGEMRGARREPLQKYARHAGQLDVARELI